MSNALSVRMYACKVYYKQNGPHDRQTDKTDNQTRL